MEISTTLVRLHAALEAAEVDADGTITVALERATVRLRFAELVRDGAEAVVADLLALNEDIMDKVYSD